MLYFSLPPQSATPSASSTEDLSKGEDDIKTWGTYLNSDFKFSIKHPPNWEASQYSYSFPVSSGDQVNAVWYVTNNPFESIGNYLKKGEYSFDITYFKPSTDIQKFIDNQIKNHQKYYEVNDLIAKEDKIGKQIVAGVKSTTYYTIGEGAHEGLPLAIKRVYVIRDNDIFELSGRTPSESDLNKFNSLFNNYLSSFKFLD